MRLFHFSNDPDIAIFLPRPVVVPSERPTGREWLNGPLVWAIDEIHQAMYLFPRDCPRVLIWPTSDTTAHDYSKWWGTRPCRIVAHIEQTWLARLNQAVLYRYELPAESFEDLDDAGMWVSRDSIVPIKVETLRHLPAVLGREGVELRVMESLVPLKALWQTSLHVSGVRLRNARDWDGQANLISR